jgi:hypothetical protein
LTNHKKHGKPLVTSRTFEYMKPDLFVNIFWNNQKGMRIVDLSKLSELVGAAALENANTMAQTGAFDSKLLNTNIIASHQSAMQVNFTVVLIDGSFSMKPYREYVAAGINEMVENLKGSALYKQNQNSVLIQISTFDEELEVVQTYRPLHECSVTTDSVYRGGGTHLLDAMGNVLVGLGAQIQDNTDFDKEVSVSFLTITDGETGFPDNEINTINEIRFGLDNMRAMFGDRFANAYLAFGGGQKTGELLGFETLQSNPRATNNMLLFLDDISDPIAGGKLIRMALGLISKNFATSESMTFRH